MTDRDLQLQKIIEDNPGIQFREIMRSSGLKNGVLSHYLGKLEKSGIVKVIRGPRQGRIYPPKITEDESILNKALRKQTPRELLISLIENEWKILGIGEIYVMNLSDRIQKLLYSINLSSILTASVSNFENANHFLSKSFIFIIYFPYLFKYIIAQRVK